MVPQPIVAATADATLLSNEVRRFGMDDLIAKP